MGVVRDVTSFGLGGVVAPLMSREAFAAAIGLKPGVVIAQCDRGLWPTVKVGKRVLINVEAVRVKCAERAADFAL